MVERVYSKLLRENLDDDARPSILEQVWWDNRPEDDKTHLLPYFDVITGETRKFVNEAIEGIASDCALDDDAVSRYFGEDWQTRDMTGQEFYDLVTQVIGENLFSLDIDPEQAASQALAYYDIDGIVYPVGVDRVEAGYEGNNYVAFSDEHLRVVRRWVWNEETETFELDRSFTPPPPTMAEARATAGDDQAIAEAQASRSSIIGRIGARRLDWAGYRLTEDEHGTRRLVQGQDGRTLLEGLRDADAEVKALVGTDFTRGERARATRLSRSGPIRRDQVALAERWHRHEIQHLIQHIEGFEGGEARKVPTWSFYANAMGEAEARVAGASATTPYGYEMDAYFRHALELTEGEIKDEDGTWRRQTYDDLTFEAQRDKTLRGQDDATQGILNQFANAKTLEALAKLAKKHLDVTAMTWGPKEGGGFEVTVEYDDDVIWWNTFGSDTGALNSMRRIFLNRYANRTSEARSSIAEVALFATGKKQTRQKVAEAYASFGVSVTPETAAVIADRINADLEEQRNARRSRLKPGEQPRDRAFGLVDALAKAYDANWAEAQKEAFEKGVAGTFGAAREMAEDIQTLMEARRQEAEAVTGTAPAVLETEMGFDIEATLMAAPEPSPRATGRRRRSPRRFTRTLSSCEMVQTSRTTTRACESCMTRRRLSLAGRIGRGDGMDSEKTSEQRGHRVYSLELLALEEARLITEDTASTALPRARDLTSTIAKPGRGSQSFSQ